MMGSVPSDRERLRTTFNSAAQLYHQARPEYPGELYDELVRPLTRGHLATGLAVIVIAACLFVLLGRRRRRRA